MVSVAQRLVIAGVLFLAVVVYCGHLASSEPRAIVKAPRITDRCLGKPAFEDEFARLDAGADQNGPSGAHRWRTVFGYGDAADPANRNGGEQGVFTDTTFTGVENGMPGAASLNLNPFLRNRETGNLVIRAEPVEPSLRKRMWGKSYSTGLLTTQFSFVQRYGYFEATVKVPAGQGAWPAFWLLPKVGTWPEGGELDIFENLGRDPSTMYFSVHWSKAQMVANRVAVGVDASQGFHSYGALWTPQMVTWYFDREPVAQTPTPAEMDRPMYMLINLGIGGTWGGFANPDDPRRFDMEIRSVKAWPLPDPASRCL